MDDLGESFFAMAYEFFFLFEIGSFICIHLRKSVSHKK
jgi:hypothetical protein